MYIVWFYLLPVGFGFLTFESEDSVDRVVNERFIYISGKQVAYMLDALLVVDGLHSYRRTGRENSNDIILTTLSESCRSTFSVLCGLLKPKFITMELAGTASNASWKGC